MLQTEQLEQPFEVQPLPQSSNSNEIPFFDSPNEGKPKRGRKATLPLTPEQRTKQRQVKEIETYLSSASIAQVEEIYLHLKSAELDQKIPGLTPQQKRAVLALQMPT